VSKVTVPSLLALTVVAILAAGCAKKEAPATEAAAPAPESGAAATQPHPMPSAAASAEVDLAGIERADGGKTVAELYAEKDQLAGQPVVVRGKVVKTNAMVMDTNWLHVRDGSGEDGTNDLTVTTKAELPKVGDTVVVSGVVTVDKDFGMGYVYPVILENAEVKIETPGS
jgi:hypothetical protein